MSNSRQVAGDIADEIKQTFTERGEVYGPPETNFSNIAAFWNAWIKARYIEANLTLDAIDVGQMSALIKMARLANTPDHRDSSLDLATYALLAAGIAAPEKSDEKSDTTVGIFNVLPGKSVPMTGAEAKVADGGGWIEFNGGPCPVDRNAKVEYRLCDPDVESQAPANWLVWEYEGLPRAAQIVAYRVVA